MGLFWCISIPNTEKNVIDFDIKQYVCEWYLFKMYEKSLGL